MYSKIDLIELRIGNSIKQGEVDAIHANGTIEVLKNSYRSVIDVSLAEPVSLNVDVLQQYGFEHIEGDVYGLTSASGFGLFYILNDGGVINQFGYLPTGWILFR